MPNKPSVYSYKQLPLIPNLSTLSIGKAVLSFYFLCRNFLRHFVWSVDARIVLGARSQDEHYLV